MHSFFFGKYQQMEKKCRGHVCDVAETIYAEGKTKLRTFFRKFHSPFVFSMSIQNTFAPEF